MEFETICLSSDSANDNGRAGGRIGGIKSLLCDQCGREEAAVDGLCMSCIGLAETLVDERRGVSDWRGDHEGR